MARLAATAVLLLCLLAVVSCRILEAEPETAVAIFDEQSQADPAILHETDAAEAIPSLPTETVVDAILRLPSHRRHGFLHRHIRWARNHGRGAFGEVRVLTAVLPEEPREAVVEPDPDGEEKPFHGDEEDSESVKAWKGEMLIRRFRGHGHGLRFHHHHHEHGHGAEKDDGDHPEQQDKEEGAGHMQQLQHVKLFSRHFHHHNHSDDDGQEETARKLHYLHHHNDHDDDDEEKTARKHHYFHHHHDHGDNEVDDVEELARRLSKAIARRSFSRGSIRHHHHAEAEEGGVRKWFKGLLNVHMF